MESSTGATFQLPMNSTQVESRNSRRYVVHNWCDYKPMRQVTHSALNRDRRILCIALALVI